MPHIPGHNEEENLQTSSPTPPTNVRQMTAMGRDVTRTTATYTIYGTNEPYSGLVVRIGDALFTTTGGAREGDSYQLIETEIIDTFTNNNLPRRNRQLNPNQNVERSLEMNTQTTTPTFSNQTTPGMDTPGEQVDETRTEGGGGY